MAALNTSYTSGSVLPAADMNATNAAVNGVTLSGTYASMPTASQPGRIYYCTDCDAVFQDTGTQWNRIQFGRGGTNQALPPTTGWSTILSTGSTVSAAADGYKMVTTGVGGLNLNYHYRTLSPTSNYTATFYFEFNTTISSSSEYGFVALSDGTKYIVFFSNGGNINIDEYWTNTSFNAHEYSASSLAGAYGMPNWMAINDDGTNRNFLLSNNGQDWAKIYSTSRTTWLTPTRIGWGINASATTGNVTYARLRSLSGIS